MNKLRQTVAAVGKNKLLQARVFEVLGDRISVQLVTNGTKLVGIPFIGGPVSVGKTVFVNYASGYPVAEARGESSTATIDKKAISRPPVMSDSESPFPTIETDGQTIMSDDGAWILVDFPSSGSSSSSGSSASDYIVLMQSDDILGYYTADDSGFASALSDSVAGDKLYLPRCVLLDDYTISKNLWIFGINNEFTVFRGTLTINADSVIFYHCLISKYFAEGEVTTISITNEGTTLALFNCQIYSNSDEDSVAIRISADSVTLHMHETMLYCTGDAFAIYLENSNPETVTADADRCNFVCVNLYSPEYAYNLTTANCAFLGNVNTIGVPGNVREGHRIVDDETQLDQRSNLRFIGFDIEDDSDNDTTIITAPESSGSSSGASTFTDLSDVPQSYSGQSGKSLRVNTNEDGLEFYTPSSGSSGGDYDLSSISGLVCWYKSDTDVTYDADNKVSQWDDQANSYNAAQAVSDSQPYYIASTEFGYPAIAFDGTDDFLATSAFPATSGSARTIVVVLAACISASGDSFEHIVHYGTDTDYCAYGICARVDGIQAFGNHYWGANMQSVAWGEMGPCVLVVSYDGSDDYMYRNGSLIGKKTVSLTTGDGEGLFIGSRILASAECGRFWIMEVAAWDKALSEVELDDLFTGLQGKYDI